MLDELKKLPQPQQPSAPSNKLRTKRVDAGRRRHRNLIKEANDKQVNPISKLMQIQQRRKEKDPIYTFVEQRGPPRRREFVVQVEAAGLKAEGTSSSKKEAKHRAAAGECTSKVM